jgi:hypothetical protein
MGKLKSNTITTKSGIRYDFIPPDSTSTLSYSKLRVTLPTSFKGTVVIKQRTKVKKNALEN